MSFGAYVTGAVLLFAWMAWLAWTRELVTLIVVAPVFAYFAGRAFINWSVDSGPQAARRAMGLGKWSGLYYEFGSIQLRAAERGDALVFLEEDILRAIGQKKSLETKFFTDEERVPYAEGKPAMALTRAGCQRLLAKSTHPESRKLLNYLEGQAFRPHAKRMERITGEE